MNSLIKEYYKLIEMDREYLKKHRSKGREAEIIPNAFNELIEKCFIWRKIKDYETLEKVVDSKKTVELLRIEDYYSEELGEILEEYLKIKFVEINENELEKIFSNESLQELLNNEHTPQRLKECIEIELKCEKICKELYIYIKEHSKNTDYDILEESSQLQMKKTDLMFGKIKKCAIFIHSSIDNKEYIARLQERLEKFCQKTLATKEYEIFLEIGSFLGERDVFENMLKRFKTEEFSHLIVVNIGQIYKLSYDMNKTIELVDRIQDMNVTIVSVDEKRVVEGKKHIINNEDLDEEV